MSLKGQVNCTQPRTGDTPLHLAASLNRTNVFGFLLLNGADVYAKNKMGIAPSEVMSSGNSRRQMEDILNQILKGHY
jgi:ankyrin repeat protein